MNPDQAIQFGARYKQTTSFHVFTQERPTLTNAKNIGVPLSAFGGSVTAREAIAVTVVGIAATGSVDLLLGSATSVGWLVSPLVWIGVIKRLCPVEWPAAATLGALGVGPPRRYPRGPHGGLSPSEIRRRNTSSDATIRYYINPLDARLLESSNGEIA